MAIVYRTNGVWGAGQGSDLSAPQIDENFHTLHLRVEDLENNPPVAVSIDHFTVEGTLLTITMTDGSEQGPFVLPVAQWRWTGPWQAVTQYFVGDIVEESGNTYFVRVQHISEATFDPTLTTVDGLVYQLILAKAQQPYDLGMYFNDRVPGGTDLLMIHAAVRDFSIPVNFEGSVAFLNTATSSSAIVLPVYKNAGEIIGTITFTPGQNLEGFGQFGVFLSTDLDNPAEFESGDRLSIGQPYEDDVSASHLAVTIVCTTPSL